MAGLSDAEKEMLYTINANVVRAMKDIQTLYQVSQTLQNEATIRKEVAKAQAEVLQQILDDRKSLFRYALGVIATTVLTASFAVLGLEWR